MSRPLSLARRLFGLLACLAIWTHATSWAAADLITRPDGAGSFYYLAFVTSGTRTAESDDITSYNDWVTAQANAVPELAALRGGNLDWYAIGSTAAVDARDNIAQTEWKVPSGVSAPVYDLHGNRIADDLDDLWDGSIQRQINVTDQDTTYNGDVWTGSWENGTGMNPRQLGGTWDPGLGDSSTTDFQWIRSNATAASSNLYPLYAISGVLPEPGSLSLGVSMALLVAGGAWYRRRRRRRNNA